MGKNFITIRAYLNYKKVSLPLEDMGTLGRYATAISRAKKLPIAKVPDEEFGVLNAYSDEVISELDNKFFNDTNE